VLEQGVRKTSTRRLAHQLSALSLSSMAFTLAACSGSGTGPGDELARLEAPLSGAETDAARTGVLAILTVTRSEVQLCTGTLIAPNLVLTARHCVAPTSSDTILDCDSVVFDSPYPAREVWVNRTSDLGAPLASFGLLSTSGDTEGFFPVAAVHVPALASVCDGDIALLVLDGQFDSAEAEPIPPRLDQPVTRGEAYVAVGFGTTPAVRDQGARRLRGGLEVACGPDQCQREDTLGANEFVGGDGVCSGDSGGPALDLDGRVFGVASRASDCTASVYSDVSAWQSWIRGVATSAVAQGDYPAPPWLVAPEVVPAAPAASSSDAGPETPAADPSLAEPETEPETAGLAPAGEGASAPLSDARGSGSSCTFAPRSAPTVGATGLLLAVGVLLSRRRMLSLEATRTMK